MFLCVKVIYHLSSKASIRPDQILYATIMIAQAAARSNLFLLKASELQKTRCYPLDWSYGWLDCSAACRSSKAQIYAVFRKCPKMTWSATRRWLGWPSPLSSKPKQPWEFVFMPPVWRLSTAYLNQRREHHEEYRRQQQRVVIRAKAPSAPFNEWDRNHDEPKITTGQ